MSKKNTIITGQYVSLEYTLASVGDRILAQIIDQLILMTYGIFLMTVLSQTLSSVNEDVFIYVMLLSLLPYILYHPIMEAFNNGQTVGKIIMKTRVISQDGTSPTLSQFILRFILLFPDSIFGLGILPIILTRYHQRFGDLASGTIVVSIKPSNIVLPNYNYAMTNYTPVYHEAQLLTVRQADVISRVIYYPNQNQRPEMINQITDKLHTTFGIVPQTPDNEDFLRCILNDYYYYCSTIEA